MSCALVIWAYCKPFSPHFRSAVQELFLAGFVAIVHMGRVWAGWTLGGVTLATALVAGGATLSNWIGRFNSNRSKAPT
jgi:hypothetical protein